MDRQQTTARLTAETMEHGPTVTPSTFDAVVIGAGIGGLSAALRLAGAGARVAVLERADTIGGKMRVVHSAGRPIDAGPTVLTMRWVFEALWADAGLDFHTAVPTERLDVLARHGWTDGSRLDLHASVDASAQAIAQFAGRKEADAFIRFHRHAQSIYDTVRLPFIEAPTPGIMAGLSNTGPRGLWQLMKIDWHRSLWKSLRSFFRDPRLVQLFARYATYSGSSPFLAPGTLALIAAVEQAGVWRVRGGMANLARATADAVVQLGGEIHTGAEVVSIDIDASGVTGVRCADGTTLRCTTVVFNGGLAALSEGLLGERVAGASPRKRPPPSLSAMTFCGIARPRGFDLHWHNVFFSDDYEAEFDDIFSKARLPTSPTTYVCAQDRGAPRDAQAGERVFCLVNAPARGDEYDFQRDTQTCNTRMSQLLERCGLDLELSDVVTTTPTQFASMFPGTRGALYGPATHGATGAFARPGVQTKIPGLFVVGGDVHPGAGVPMVTLGGRIAADRVCDRLGLTRRSPPAATRGGTSTRSATTASSR